MKTVSQKLRGKMLGNAKIDIFKILNESKTIWYSRFFEYSTRVLSLDCNLHFLHNFTGPKFGLITRRKTENVESDLRKNAFPRIKCTIFLRNYGCL